MTEGLGVRGQMTLLLAIPCAGTGALLPLGAPEPAPSSLLWGACPPSAVGPGPPPVPLPAAA